MIINLEPKKKYLDVKEMKVGISLDAKISGPGIWIEGNYQGEKTNTFYLTCTINGAECLVKTNKASREDCAKSFNELDTDKWVGQNLLVMIIPSTKAKSGKSYVISPLEWKD